jgi:hypothetical protein
MKLGIAVSHEAFASRRLYPLNTALHSDQDTLLTQTERVTAILELVEEGRPAN